MLLHIVVTSVEIEWHGDHSAARCFTLKIARGLYWYWISWDRAGPLGGKWTPLVGKVGEWYLAGWLLQGCSPYLCLLRTDGLAPASQYWMYRSHPGDMGPVSLVVCSSTDVWLKCTASMIVLGEKLRWVSRATQPGWEVESGALFLGSSESVQLYWVSVKGCHVRGPPAGSVRMAYVDWHVKHTRRVD
jgi:hypothetical protein